MLPERDALPGDDEIEAALREYHALFGGEEHEATLREQREEALVVDEAASAFRPLLVGGVAEGWATEHSDIRLELSADDAKARRARAHQWRRKLSLAAAAQRGRAGRPLHRDAPRCASG